jgi:hypothetical protein
MAFELLGWDNPHGCYPAPVVPIGKLDGQLVAVYPGAEKHEIPIFKTAVYRHFSIEQLETLRGFDHRVERLLATDENHVLRYSTINEAAFFVGLLVNPDFCKGFPRMRNILRRVADRG